MAIRKPLELGNPRELNPDSNPCVLHKYHSPRPQINHEHHVFPKGKGGPDKKSNTVSVCPTGHVNVHSVLRELERYDGDLPTDILRSYGYAERALAQRGWDAYNKKKDR